MRQVRLAYSCKMPHSHPYKLQGWSLNLQQSQQYNDFTHALLLCRYDLPDVQAVAERFLLKIKLDVNNIIQWLEVAYRLRIKAAIERCLQFAEAPGNMRSLFACVQQQRISPVAAACGHLNTWPVASTCIL